MTRTKTECHLSFFEMGKTKGSNTKITPEGLSAAGFVEAVENSFWNYFIQEKRILTLHAPLYFRGIKIIGWMADYKIEGIAQWKICKNMEAVYGHINLAKEHANFKKYRKK